jgi:multiple sugar transport system permease protein
MSTTENSISEIIGKGHRKVQLENLFKSFVFYLLVIGVFIWCVFPFFFAFLQSFVNTATRRNFEFIPADPTYSNYQTVFDTFHFQKYIINSAYISILTTITCVIIAAFAGYVLATFSFRAKGILMLVILSMTMFPGIIIAIPLLSLYVQEGKIVWPILNTTYPIVNTYIPGLLIPYIAFNLPLTVFLLYNFFQEIPRELILAARVDGASNFQVFRKIILPLAIPGVFTTAILVFIASWNEFLFASILITNAAQNGTVPLALAKFQGIPTTGELYDPLLSLMAACVIVTLPLVIVVLIFQKQIVSGITAGAVKG